jgi:hypothetical protein
MKTRRLTFPAVAALALASIVLGALAALADGRDVRRARAAAAPRPAAVTAAPTPLPVAVAVPPGCVGARPKPPAAAPVPQAILDAFGVLRRDRTPDDALPAAALTALRGRGLEPFDPAAARLLRRTADGGRAWVVPVRDVAQLGGLQPCILRGPLPAPVAPAPRPPSPPAPERAPGAPAPTVPTPPPTARPVPSAPPVAATPVPAPAPSGKAHPGLAVVALGGAPAGAGGRLEDLLRGREDVAIDPCGGPGHDMLSVSGLVPDGVAAAFLTSPDGTAVRADVQDNGYAFVVPRTRTAEQRYVVWTGADGTPHVQPLGAPAFLGRVRCATKTTNMLAPVVSPDAGGLCGRFALPLPLPVRPSKRRTPPPLLLDRAPCVIASAAAPPAVRAPSKTPRPPRRHG